MSQPTINQRIFRNTRKIVAGAVFLLLLVYLASGIYSVKPEQTGIVKRFGEIIVDDVSPGIHYHWPWPIESVTVPNTKEVRSLTLTFDRTSATGGDPSGGALLTGDENLLLLTLMTQYTIERPKEYFTASEDPVALLERYIQSSCMRIFAGMLIEDALTTARNRIQQDLRRIVQKKTDELHLGLRIVSMQIKQVEPPQGVARAFKDVASAREDAHKLLQEANGERNRRLPEARADAERMTRESEAVAGEMVQIARGDAARFLANWKQYRKARDVTAHRLYMENIEKILPRVRKQIINPDAERNVGRGDVRSH